MCWAVPAKVVSIESEVIATIDLGGNSLKKVAIGVDNLKIGDYVMVHAGVIIAKLTKEELIENIKYIAEQIREVAGIEEEDPDKAVNYYIEAIASILNDNTILKELEGGLNDR
ncbi:HypC/HybG/HupF family hydrogenase formation chaperone [Saccharolobus shibatae]|uniref:[NiFe] hydrogenase metallocenter assembly protein HypC n=1 Tax=Saccharolobus shibatae TaxID=2286 RepID=A0A8F5C1U8_9CREN|nr:HypC/HybG/HupF family hydrogenase formation chaperone [Saccharolobus shibatae]QXJ35532.1 [NiFe] hydrogenase metallocenter assembly protein HypC [Saccharolobus shibatae]